MKVHESSTQLSQQQALALPRESRASDWHGARLPIPLSWSIALDPQALWFVCTLPGGGRSSSTSGEFVEGLWEEDVAELFIKSPSGAYQELNIAPSGAWWSMTLTDYRVRSEVAQRPHLLSLSTFVDGESWNVVVSLARSTMEVPVSPDSLLHVSGMWYQPQPCYLSSRPAPDEAPDYHHRECFERAVMLPVPASA